MGENHAKQIVRTGRARARLSPETCADEIVAGMVSGKATIYVGKSTLLRATLSLSLDLVDRILRNG